MYAEGMRWGWIIVLLACGESTVADVGTARDAGRDAPMDARAFDTGRTIDSGRIDSGRADSGDDARIVDAGLPDIVVDVPGFDANIDGSCGSGVDDGPIVAAGFCASTPAMVAPTCPEGAPDRAGLMGECCYRLSNATRPPELRISALRFSTPATLSAGLVRSAISDMIDEERMNWLLRFDADGELLQTGHGFRNTDGTFSFACGDASSPGDPNRWDARLVAAELSDDAFSSAPAARLGIATTGVGFEFPFREARFECANLSVARTCVGTRNGSVYQTDHGSIEAFITVEDAAAIPVRIPPIDSSVCNFIAGMASETRACTEVPTSSWPVPPNAACDATGCSTSCTGDACNAWRVQAGFGAHGVEIR